MPKIYGFEEKDCERIKRSVRRFEDYYQTGQVPMRRRRYPVASGEAGGLVPCVITSAVLAGSEANPTQFSATTEVMKNPGPGWTTTGGSQVTAYNRAPGVSWSTPTSPKSAWLTVIGGFYYLVAADC